MNTSPVRTRLPRGLKALSERNYLLYFIGHFTSHTGYWIEQTAVSWILYELTDSAILLGIAGLCRATPLIFLSLLGGAIADRVPKRLLLLMTESTMLLSSFTIGVIIAVGQLQFWHLYVLSTISGTLAAFSIPARQSLFPELVKREHLPSAINLNGIAVHSARLIGPSIAGIALAAGGHDLPFFLNAASFLGMLGALCAIRLSAAASPVGKPVRPSLWKGMAEGVSFVWRNPPIRVILGLELLTGLFSYNSAIITIIARDVLNQGPQGLGILLSALGAGTLVGMLLMLVVHTEKRGRIILMVGAIFTLLLLGFGLSTSLVLSIVLLFLLGATDGIWGVARNTMVQLAIPNVIRGRAMSVVILASRGSTPLGHLQSGFLASLIGGPATILVGASIIGTGLLCSWQRLFTAGTLEKDPKPGPNLV